MHRRDRPVPVAGDNERAARRIAKQLGIDRIHTGMRVEGEPRSLCELLPDAT